MKILIIEDEQSSADRLRRMLEGEPMEKREQSDACISSAESRERKSEAQFDQEDGLFKFEKRMIRKKT